MVESSNPELEKKVADLEAEVARLKGENQVLSELGNVCSNSRARKCN